VTRRVAIVGAGWAGLAAAVEAADRGHAVTLFEAARVAGGRARTVPVTLPDGATALLDNGQHILIGAYLETLRLMEKVGVDADAALLRLPLVLRDPRGEGLALPAWPAPWDALAGILGARGWNARDKLSLLRAAAGWRLRGFRCDGALTVAQLTRTLRPRVREQLIAPLCVAALNTPAERASAQVFLRVLRDALFGRGHRGWLAARGARLRLGERVRRLAGERGTWSVDGEDFDAVVLATPSSETLRLLADCDIAAGWREQAGALRYEAIATVYASGGPSLPSPMLALACGPGAPAQFVFDRGQLGGPAGLLAFVASASSREGEALEREVLAQAAALGWRVQPVKTIIEKRATFACVPGLRRPPPAIAAGLWACGDYVEGPYPATLEGAVRAGVAVARQLDA
jgi:predicted NAD/FAD-binding protein